MAIRLSDHPSGTAPLYGKCYLNPAISANPSLVVVLHGDAPFREPDGQYELARRIAEESNDVVAVGLLRPGYTDPEGNRSPGRRGHATGDNYTLEVIESVVATVRNLREIYKARRIFIVGHSGGSAIAAILLGLAPGLVAGAVLVSCPSDVGRFRKHMRRQRKNPIWKILWTLPIRSVSPIDLVPCIDPATHITLLVGTDDDVTPAALTYDYVEHLKARNFDVEIVRLEGRDHEIFMDETVRLSVRKMLEKCIGK